MTKNKAHKAETYHFQAAERILVDANVWLFLYPPAGAPTSEWSHDYSSIYKRLLEAKAKPVIDTLVISEYLNRYFRLEYNGGWREYYRDFKEFRKTRDFANLASDAVEEIREILKIASLLDTPLTALNVDNLLEPTAAGKLDFNDAVLVSCCREYGCKLLTNDEDCSTGGIEVITALPALIRACN